MSSRFWWTLYFVGLGIELLCTLALLVELLSPGAIRVT